MGYTPLARWRNFTVENIKSILKIYPDMTSDLSRHNALNAAEESLKGYKRTAYQHACQLGLECRGEKFKVQNYLYSFDDENLKKYLNFWFKMYVVPNPYVNSTEAPISIYQALAYELQQSGKYNISFDDFTAKYFGDGKSNDILRNAIKEHGAPVSINSSDEIYLVNNDIEELKRIEKKVRETLPMKNNMSEEEFFERFSYEKFCAYYDLPCNLSDIETDAHNSPSIKESNSVTKGTNILLYGVPGSGKSYQIKEKYCNDFSFMERVVFHPDYMNTDFVGQILPIAEGEGDNKRFTYDFIPGPFTRILKKSIGDPNNNYYLVIEEVNRGNAPAIFGEIFQLLDRDASGRSSYEITNYNIASEVFNNPKKSIYIPSNLHLLATMNTADQNVFTLDTAFQRRWNMKMIENDITAARHSNIEILDTSVTWGEFNKVINSHILNVSESTLTVEDKRLGAYFVAEDLLEYHVSTPRAERLREIDEEEGAEYKTSINRRGRNDEAEELNTRFGDKVIKYLWDDVFKFNREDLFSIEYRSLEQVLKDFNTFQGNERFNIFKQDVIDNLLVIPVEDN